MIKYLLLFLLILPISYAVVIDDNTIETNGVIIKTPDSGGMIPSSCLPGYVVQNTTSSGVQCIPIINTTIIVNNTEIFNNSLSNDSYVPYNGSTGDVFLGDHNLNVTNISSMGIIRAEYAYFTQGGVYAGEYNDYSGGNPLFQWINPENYWRMYENWVGLNSMNITLNASDSWFNGLFNWVITPGVSQKYISFDGHNLTFNETTLNASMVQNIDPNTAMKNESNYFKGINNTFNASISFGDEDPNVKTLWRYRANDYGQAQTDGFRVVYYPSFGDGLFDDWMVFEKTDGNDAVSDGGIAFRLYNSTGANITILRLDGNGLANFSDQIITYSVKAIDNMTATWFNGKFNWTTSDSWNSFDGSTLSFNETKLNNTIAIETNGRLGNDTEIRADVNRINNTLIGTSNRVAVVNNSMINNFTQVREDVNRINNTQIADNITVTDLANTKAYPGICPNGQVVNETNTTGVVCVAVGASDWSPIQTNLTGEINARIANDTNNVLALAGNISSANVTATARAFPGACTAGQVVNQTTITGVVCTVVAFLSDISAIATNLTGEINARIANNTDILLKLSGNISSANATATTAISNLNSAVISLANNITSANTTASARAFPGVCPSGQVVNQTTTTGVVCVAPAAAFANTSTQCAAGQYATNVSIGNSIITSVCATPAGGGGVTDFGSVMTNQKWSTEFCTINANAYQDFFGLVIGTAGAAVVTPGDNNHVCAQNFSDSTTANSGYMVGLHTAINQNLIHLNGSEIGTFIFRPAVATINWTVRMGFMDNILATSTVVSPVDGCYVQWVNRGPLIATCRSNNAETNVTLRAKTGEGENLSASEWYKVVIRVQYLNLVNFTIYNSTDGQTNLLNSSIVTTNIPYGILRGTSFGIIASQTTTAAAQPLVTMDYMELSINRTLVK
jgi:hypothetical protein